MRTATPNDVHTQQGAKPACQEDITVNFSHLLLAQLPRTQFTHSKLPNPHARKTSPYIFRTSYWHSYPEHSYTNRSRGPAATRRAATPSGGSKYCACHADRSRNPFCLPRRQEPRPSGDQARRNPFWRLQVLRLHGAAAQRRPGAPQPPSTAPARRTGGSKYCACHTDRSRGPAATRRATLSGGSKYCACHADRSRGPAATRRTTPPLLQAPSTAPATQTGAAAQRRPGAPQPLLEPPSTAPATQTGAAAQRRPGAPQPLLEAPSTAPATQTERLPHRCDADEMMR